MRTISKVLFLTIFIIPVSASSQQKDSSLTRKLDSLDIKADSLKHGQKNNIGEEAYKGAKIDIGTYFTLLKDDFKQQVTRPLHTSKKEWIKIGGFAAVTGAVALVNEPVSKFAVKQHDENPAIASISKYVTNFGGAYELYTIAGFYTYGLIFKTQKEKTTTVLATQAYITAAVFSFAAKYLSGEQRPYYTDPISNKKGPIFHGPFYPFKKEVDLQSYSSFPSGHTTAAFAAATVYASEYKDKPLIPIISYSAATLIGLSRLTENKHWPTDVLVGAMLGYVCGKQVVNNFHRYSKLKKGKTAKAPILLNFNYSNKQFFSGLTYNF